jgi:hypothetical protein
MINPVLNTFCTSQFRSTSKSTIIKLCSDSEKNVTKI